MDTIITIFLIWLTIHATIGGVRMERALWNWEDTNGKK